MPFLLHQGICWLRGCLDKAVPPPPQEAAAQPSPFHVRGVTPLNVAMHAPHVSSWQLWLWTTCPLYSVGPHWVPRAAALWHLVPVKPLALAGSH